MRIYVILNCQLLITEIIIRIRTEIVQLSAINPAEAIVPQIFTIYHSIHLYKKIKIHAEQLYYMTWCMVVWCTQNLRRDAKISVDIQKASHSCRITCERSESAHERRILLYKSSHHHHHHVYIYKMPTLTQREDIAENAREIYYLSAGEDCVAG